MAFSRGTINPREAARGMNPGQINNHLLAALQKIQKDVADLKERAGTQATDYDLGTPVAQIPALAAAAVTASNGIFSVAITNPEYILRSGSVGVRINQNPRRAPILHRISFSLTPGFDAQGDVRYYGPSTQTHWPVVDIGPSLRYVRLESSYDGQNWNKTQTIGPFQS